jgi:hypothetical protein
MRWVRLWLPLAIIAGGVVAIAARGGSVEGWEGGGAIIGAGLAVWLLNFFFRVGVKGDQERDEEDAARDFFTAHGYWPDEAPPPGPAPRPVDPHRAPRPDPHARPQPHPPGRAGTPARRRPRRP